MLSLSDRPTPVRPGGPKNDGDAPAWRRELRDAFRDPHALCEHLGLPARLANAANDRGFPLLAPRPFVARMRPGDPNDPLLLQVMPREQEADESVASCDAVGDLAAQREAGLLHKYHGRALLMVASSCAVNCRYCFRRHFPYGEMPRGDAAWAPAINALEQDASIQEAILSGGDPLVLSDTRLARLVDRLESIPHLRRLRIHTRLPIVIPQRVTSQLCDLLRRIRVMAVVVLHINHAQEIDAEVAGAIEKLRETGAILLNQSVLLRGVNDSTAALGALSERLIDVGVTPYYLHQLDLVAGVGHYEVDEERGLGLVEELRKRLPGYAVPRYVQERPGEPHKSLLG